jgi:hypothetical protein
MSNKAAIVLAVVAVPGFLAVLGVMLWVGGMRL